MKKFILTLICLSLLVNPAFAGDTTGLVAYYKMDSAANGTEPDSSGLANDLTDTNSNVGSTTGQFDSARNFDSSTDLLQRADDSDFDMVSSDMSIVAWINHSDPGNNNRDWVGKITGGNGWEWWKNFDETQRFVVQGTTSSGTATTDITLSANQHVGAVFSDSGNTVTFYQDDTGGGSSNSEAISNTATIANSTASLTFGPVGRSHPSGWFDEVMIFSRVLTADEVADIKNNGGTAFITSARRYSPVLIMLAMPGIVLADKFHYYDLVNQHRTKFGISRPFWMQIIAGIGLFKNKPLKK